MEGLTLMINGVPLSGGVIVSGGTTLQVAISSASGAAIRCSGNTTGPSTFTASSGGFIVTGSCSTGIAPNAAVEASSGGTIFYGAVNGVNSISFSSKFTIDTTLPADPNETYSRFVADKYTAMANGGVATFNGISCRFAAGYSGVCDNLLMTINGVSGDSGGFTISPSPGFWAEMLGGSSGYTVLRWRPCISCEGYNKLFAAEMVLYHAVNHVAWQLLDNGIRPNYSASTAPGTWYRYQGLLAYWNFRTFADSFLNYNASVRENLAVNVGYANPTCEPVYTVCISIITPLGFNTPAELQKQLVFYPGNLISPKINRDNNQTQSGVPIPFMIGGADTSSAYIYCPNGMPDSTLLSQIPYNSTNLAAIVNGGHVVSTLQEFGSRPTIGTWVVGLAGSLGGQEYAAQPFTLGAVGDSAYEVNDTGRDTYSIHTQWYIGNSQTTLEGPYYKAENNAQFTTYSLKLPE